MKDDSKIQTTVDFIDSQLPQQSRLSQSSLTFNEGIKSGIPIAVGYIPISVAFGLLAKSAGVPDYLSILMSLMVFAGASQFVAVNLITLGVMPFEIITATFILNLRHFLMSASISQKLEKSISKTWMSIISFGITDETFTVASLRSEEEVSRDFMLGLNLVAYSAWVFGTAVGVFLAPSLPESLKSSMGIALYAMFIGLLVPALKNSPPVLTVSLTAAIINSFLNYVPMFINLSAGWAIIISTIASSCIGAIIYPKGVKVGE